MLKIVIISRCFQIQHVAMLVISASNQYPGSNFQYWRPARRHCTARTGESVGKFVTAIIIKCRLDRKAREEKWSLARHLRTWKAKCIRNPNRTVCFLYDCQSGVWDRGCGTNSCLRFAAMCCKTPFMLSPVNHIRQNDNRVFGKNRLSVWMGLCIYSCMYSET